MNTHSPITPTCDPCPKSGWIMDVFTDDEAPFSHDDLPRGIAFHLARCESCRALADRLRATVGGVGDLGAGDPPTDLIDRADSQAYAALMAGGAYSGHSAAEDLIITPPAHRPMPMLRLAPYAAAACLLLVVGAGIWLTAAGPWRHAPHPTARGDVNPRLATRVDRNRPAASLGSTDARAPDTLNSPDHPDATPAAPRVATVNQRHVPIPRDHFEGALGSENHNVQAAFVLPGLRGRRVIDRPIISYQTTTVLPEPQP